MRRTKIVATIGPATESEERLEALIRAGVDVIRLNFSHGTHESHAQVIERVRRIAAGLHLPVAILQDLQGPKIRTGALAGGAPVLLADGATFTLTTRPVEGTASAVSTTYAGLPQDVRPGDRILLDDGLIELRVEAVQGQDVITRVVHGGLLGEHKGINLPGIATQAPALTEKDREDLAFGLAQGVDYVALSFVRRAEDVLALRQAIAELLPLSRSPQGWEIRSEGPGIIAKLEKPQALDNLEAILEACDGVMVARGDLGVELSPQQVPIAQKTIIEAANRTQRFVITATQMLESMITHPRPTRAEASDVANAIFDGTDAVMLSGETAVGAYPVEAVRMMAAIAEEAEAHLARWGSPVLHRGATQDDALAIVRAARELAEDRGVRAICAFTRTGRTARLMSKERPHVPILAFTPFESVRRYLALAWGVVPCLLEHRASVEEMLAGVEEALKARGLVQPGDQVVVTGGLPVDVQTPTNFIKLHTVGG